MMVIYDSYQYSNDFIIKSCYLLFIIVCKMFKNSILSILLFAFLHWISILSLSLDFIIIIVIILVIVIDINTNTMSYEWKISENCMNVNAYDMTHCNDFSDDKISTWMVAVGIASRCLSLIWPPAIQLRDSITRS